MRFILIDRFLTIEPGRRAVAVKSFAEDDPIFRDHFPGAPIVPGVLITEAMNQTAGWAIAAGRDFTTWPILNMVQSAKFRHFARPGDEIVIETEVENDRESDILVRGTATVGGVRIADARLSFHCFTELPGLGDPAAFASWARETFARLDGFAVTGART